MKLRIQQALVLVLVAILNIGAVEAQTYEHEGHTYFLTSAGTWAEAEAEAENYGGHLVSVNDADEQDFINGMLSGSTWIGFTDEGSVELCSGLEFHPAGTFFLGDGREIVVPSGQCTSVPMDVPSMDMALWGCTWNDGTNQYDCEWDNYTINLGCTYEVVDNPTPTVGRPFTVNLVGCEGSSSWGWINGDPVTYTNWAPLEPNGGAGENCGVSEEAWGGLWNDLPCDRVHRGIVELEPDWSLVDVTAGFERSSMGIAYDSDREVVVVFGGRTVEAFSDTWEYDGASWTQVVTPNAPIARFWHSMVYDSNRQRMVLYGGMNEDLGILFADTWEYDGSDWQEVVTTTSPPAMRAMSMAFDSHANKVVLFGGAGYGGEYNSTWEYDGINWSQVTTAASPPRGTLAAMAFDSVRNRTVFYGSGVVFDPAPSDTGTWEYDGVNWTEVITPTMPPGRWAHSMVYDNAHQRMVLLGGYSVSLPFGGWTNDTWVYDGFDWTQIFTDTVPPEKEQHGMAYDSARNRVVLFGGWGGPGNDTWEFIDEVSPLEQVDGTLRFVDYAIENGDLEGSGPGKSSNGRIGALINMIENVGTLIDNGFTNRACELLLDASKRTDGLTPPPDFVTGPAAVELEQLIQNMLDSQDC